MTVKFIFMWRKRFIGPFLSDLPRHTPRHVFPYVRPRSLPTIQLFPAKIKCPPSSDLRDDIEFEFPPALTLHT